MRNHLAKVIEYLYEAHSPERITKHGGDLAGSCSYCRAIKSARQAMHDYDRHWTVLFLCPAGECIAEPVRAVKLNDAIVRAQRNLRKTYPEGDPRHGAVVIGAVKGIQELYYGVANE